MVAQAALVIWMVIGIALFAVLPPRRAFLLTFVVGYLFLPVEVGSDTHFVGSLYFTQSLRIDKLTACNIAALVGTCVFAPDILRRYRFHWVDAVFVLLLAGAFATSLVSGVGAKDGVSHVVEDIRRYAPLMILSRLYLTGPLDLLEAMRVILAGAFAYAFLCMLEWRFSPQTHRLVYGYFQHDFVEFMRYGHFRPVGFLHHAIEASFFLGTSTALAAWLWFKGLLEPLWGIVPGWLVALTLLLGTLSTMTYSGIAACGCCLAVLALCALKQTRWWLIVLPAFAVVWMGGRYTGAIDAHFLMRITNSMDPARSDSLAYRLESERLNLAAAAPHILLGKGANQGVLRDDNGVIVKAVDAYWLITLIFYGIVGLATWYLFWGAGLIDTLRRWTFVLPDVQALLAGVCVILGAQYVDFLFNAFPSPFLLMLSMSAVAILQHARSPLPQHLPRFIEPAANPEFPLDWVAPADLAEMRGRGAGGGGEVIA